LEDPNLDDIEGVRESFILYLIFSLLRASHGRAFGPYVYSAEPDRMDFSLMRAELINTTENAWPRGIESMTFYPIFSLLRASHGRAFGPCVYSAEPDCMDFSLVRAELINTTENA
jgi:hypothetical protein